MDLDYEDAYEGEDQDDMDLVTNRYLTLMLGLQVLVSRCSEIAAITAVRVVTQC
jgi:hypothetical protein